MKRNALIAMLVAIFLFGGINTEAQVGSFLKEKAKNAVTKGLKRGDEKQTEQTQEEEKPQKEEEQKSTKPVSNPANSFMQRKMMGMMGMNNVKYDLSYSYTSKMSMDIESVDSAQTEVNKATYTTYFDKNSKNFAMEFETVDKESGQKQKSLMIFDYKNLAMLILSDKDGERSGVAMAIPPDSTQTTTEETQPTEEVKQEDLSAYNMFYKPTGRTKQIAGYACKEYAYENPEGRVEVWATNDFKYDYSNAYGHMYGFQALATGGTTYLLGTVLEMHFKDNNSPARSDLYVKEIDANTSKTFSIADYQIVGFGGDSNTSKPQK